MCIIMPIFLLLYRSYVKFINIHVYINVFIFVCIHIAIHSLCKLSKMIKYLCVIQKLSKMFLMKSNKNVIAS